MGIGTKFARLSIDNQYDNIQPFWDKQNPFVAYSELNDVEVPTEAQIREFQIKEIEQAENMILQNKFNDLNKNVINQPLNNLVAKFNSEENARLSEALTNLSKAGTDLYVMKRWGGLKETSAKASWTRVSNDLLHFSQALNKLIAMTSANGNVVLEQYVKQLQDAYIQVQMHIVGDKNSTLQQVLTNINQIKGAVVEEIGMEWLNSLSLPDTTKAIRVGDVSLNTQEATRHRGQLIQDILVFDMTQPNILNTPIEYTPVGNKDKKLTMTLGEFLQLMDSHNNEQKSISLTDNGYTALLDLNQLGIQAKSGLKQALWNQSKYNKVRIDDFSPNDGLKISIHRTFELLHSLDQEKPKDEWVNDSGDNNAYDDLASYGLGTVAAKILHISEHDGNQYVLTPQGFTTFGARMKTLLRENNYIMHLRQKVTINDKTLSTEYDVAMNK